MDWARLAKICEMMGSSHTGERAAAAHKATVLLRAEGMTWTDLVDKAGQPAEKVYLDNRPLRERVHHARILYFLDERRNLLSEWENEFVSNLIDRWMTRSLTDRQWDVLEGLAIQLKFEG